jgi:protease-3
VTEILARLIPEHARIFQIGSDQPADKKAFFYETAYSARPIEEADLERWAEAARTTTLQMPDLNPFIPDDFSLVTGVPVLPHKITDKPGLSVWQAASRFRQEPKAILLTRLQSPHFSSTVTQEAMQGILLELWNQKQAGLRYQAQEAGLNLSISGDEGVNIRINGFSMHQADLLPRVVEFLNEEVSPEDFEQAKTEYLRGLANQAKQGVFGQAMRTVGDLLRVPSWDRPTQENAAQAVTLEDWKAWLAAVRKDMRCTVFGFGNIAAEDLQDLGRVLTPYAASSAAPETRRIRPVPGVVADYHQDIALEDSALVELFLDPEPGAQAQAHILLLENLLSTRFYSRLRTEEQLGYVTTTFPVIFAHCAGLGFGVQSPVAGTAELSDRFASFYFHALQQMRGVTKEEFEDVRQGLLAGLTKTPDTLEEEFSRLETDLRLGNAEFNSRDHLIQALREATLPQVVRLYETLILGSRGTRVQIQAQGRRFQDVEPVKTSEAKKMTKPGEFHNLMDVQRYQGL